MGNILGIINLMNEQQDLNICTADRNVASIPFDERYRRIDFIMSNFINSGISLVALFPKEPYLSVVDDKGTGKEWNKDGRTGRLYILPPIQPYETVTGDMMQFHDHLRFFKQANADTVIITSGHHICKLDYNKMIDFHRESGANITAMFKDFSESLVEKRIYHKYQLNQDERVENINLYTVPEEGDPISLETYVISKSIFIELIEKCIAKE